MSTGIGFGIAIPHCFFRRGRRSGGRLWPLVARDRVRCARQRAGQIRRPFHRAEKSISNASAHAGFDRQVFERSLRRAKAWPPAESTEEILAIFQRTPGNKNRSRAAHHVRRAETALQRFSRRGDCRASCRLPGTRCRQSTFANIPVALAEALARARRSRFAGDRRGRPATDPRFGDYQTQRRAHSRQTARRKSARASRRRSSTHLDVDEMSETPTVAGAGFINFALDREAVAQQTARASAATNGSAFQDRRSPQTNRHRFRFAQRGQADACRSHPQHRSRRRARAHRRISRARVIRDNHIGDWGTQFGMVIYGWKNLLDRDSARRAIRSPSWSAFTKRRTNARRPIRRCAKPAARNWSNCRPATRKISRSGRRCVDLSMQEFERAYEILDIHYDIQRGESFYNDRLPGGGRAFAQIRNRRDQRRRGLRFLPRHSRAGGQAVHHSQKRRRLQLRHHRHRDGRLSHQRFEGATRFGTWWARRRRCISNRSSRSRGAKVTPPISATSLLAASSGEDRKLMKTRSGENVPLRDLLDEAIARARKIVEEKNPELSEAEKNEIAQNDRHRRGQVCRSLAVPNDRLHFFLGPDVIVPGKHGAIFAKRLRAHSLDFSQGGRRVSSA